MSRKSVADEPTVAVDSVPAFIRRQIISAARGFLLEKRQAAKAELGSLQPVKEVVRASRRISRATLAILHLQENVLEQKAWREERRKLAEEKPMEQSELLKEACELAAQLNHLSNKSESKEQVAAIVESINKCMVFIQDLQKACAAQGELLAEAADFMSGGPGLSHALLLELQKDIASMQDAIERSRATVETLPEVMLDMDQIVEKLSFKVVHMIKSSKWLRGAKAAAAAHNKDGDQEEEEKSGEDLDTTDSMSEDQEIHLAEISGQENSKELAFEPLSTTDSNEEACKTNHMQALTPHVPLGPPPPGGSWLAARQRQHVHQDAGTRAGTPSEARVIGDEEAADSMSTAQGGWDEDLARRCGASEHAAHPSILHSIQAQEPCRTNAGCAAHAPFSKVELQASQNSSRFDQQAAQDQTHLEDLRDTDLPTLESCAARVVPRSATTDASGTTVASGSLELLDAIPVSSRRRASSSKAELRKRAPSAGQKLDAPASRASSKYASRSAWPTMEDLSSSEWDVLESIVGKKSKDQSGFRKKRPYLPSTSPTTLPMAKCPPCLPPSPLGSPGSSPKGAITVPSTPSTPSHPLALPRILSPTFPSSSRMR